MDKKSHKTIIPRILQIETINGICNADCEMCSKALWTRKPFVMSEDMFEKIIKRFAPYKDKIDFVTLHYCGEPLLDKGLCKKIKIAKEMGFVNVGFATNCMALDNQICKKLLKSGLDSLICSVEGATAETHEKIRNGTKFEKVVENIKNFISLRNELDANTRVLIRMVLQELNRAEWPSLQKFWHPLLNKAKYDDIIRMDLHYWGKGYSNQEKKNCHGCADISERFLITSTGRVCLCCADYNNDFFDLGNVLEKDPIEIYNNEIFTKYREKIREGKIQTLEHCRDCELPAQQENRIIAKKRKLSE